MPAVDFIGGPLNGRREVRENTLPITVAHDPEIRGIFEETNDLPLPSELNYKTITYRVHWIPTQNRHVALEDNVSMLFTQAHEAWQRQNAGIRRRAHAALDRLLDGD